MIQSKIIFDFFCFFKSTIVFSDDRNGESATKNIKSGGQTSRSAADDNDVLHNDYLLIVTGILLICLLSV